MFINKRNTSLESEQIFRLHQTGLSHQQIGEIYQLSERTIYRRKKGSNKPKLKRGRKNTITSDILNILLNYVDKNNTTTQQEFSDYLYKKTGLIISQQVISYTLKKQGITRKKITYHYCERSEKKLAEFKQEIKPLLSLPICALDECSFKIGETPRYGYSQKGLRAISQRIGKRSISYTLILCVKSVNKSGVLGYKLIEKGAKSKDFHEFLSELNWDKDNFLLLDNARIHHATKSCQKLGLSTIGELLNSKEITPKYLPPYTPLNWILLNYVLTC